MRNNPFNEIYKSAKYNEKTAYWFPEIVDLELTNNCNLRCKMCARQNMTRLKGFMSDETFKQVSDECNIYNAGLRLIGWGEPFLHSKIIDFCKYHKEKTISSYYDISKDSSPLHITNNGQIINEKQMKDLVDIGLDSIIFSFQGATKEGYEKMRIGSSYDKLTDSINKLVAIRGDKEKPFIHISSTMTDDTNDEISNFVNHWQKIVDSVGIGRTKPLEVNSGEFHKYVPCKEVLHKLTVKWDGQVSACCGDSNNILIVGSMKDSSLKEIWDKSPELRSIRLLLANNRHRTLTLCKDCSHAYSDF